MVVGEVGVAIVRYFMCCGVSKSFAAQEKRGSLWNRVNRVSAHPVLKLSCDVCV
jgi:hypothetical protein